MLSIRGGIKKKEEVWEAAKMLSEKCGNNHKNKSEKWKVKKGLEKCFAEGLKESNEESEESAMSVFGK